MTTATKTIVNSQSLSQIDNARDSVKTVILASMIGTAIEFFDFYAYGTAAATYFPKVFFPEVTTTIATLLSLLTFGVAFVARPLDHLSSVILETRLAVKKHWLFRCYSWVDQLY
ncbi:hypothetical protein [Liquorilactobacillus hordei]|uniref:hypothetical protein n=1 Tax=Liquorilactobacillus hordei TaxID=468911 RepID=UPI002159F1F7|nr:hypothetical protein [Liquorilactobacillus hordei]